MMQPSAASLCPPMLDTDKTPRPLDALWQAPAIIWVLLAGECLAVVLALAPGASGDRWVQFGLASLVIQWVALLTLGALYLFRRALEGMRPQRLAYLALGLLLINTWLVRSEEHTSELQSLMRNTYD